MCQVNISCIMQYPLSLFCIIVDGIVHPTGICDILFLSISLYDSFNIFVSTYLDIISLIGDSILTPAVAVKECKIMNLFS